MHISINCRKKKKKKGLSYWAWAIRGYAHIFEQLFKVSFKILIIVNNYWEERRIKLLINVKTSINLGSNF